jgi:membrane protease subunit HflK
VRYLLGLALVLLLLSLLTGVTQVRPGERAVIRRFGRVLDDKPGPGLYVGLPWGMDRVDRVPVDRLRRVTVGYLPAEADDSGQTPPGQMVTGDHNLIDIQVEVYYAVKEDEVARFVLQADKADELVARAAESALVEWVAGKTVDDLVSGDRAALQTWLAEQTQARLKPYELGVAVQSATVTYLNPPAEVKEAFADVARAATERETKINQARQEATRTLQEAERDAFRLSREAASYVREQLLLARADAETFTKRLQQYQRLRKENPAYLAGLWWDEMTRLFTQMRQNGRVDLLDNHLGADGLDITQMPMLPKKR